MFSENDLFQSRILIVDDQLPNVVLLDQILKNAGYKNIKTTTNPLEVVNLYQEFQPHLVLLDLNMPKMDGFTVMKSLKVIERGSYIPVLVLTASDHPTVRNDALMAGAKDFLGKPFDISEVLCRIRNILEVRLLHNQVREQNQHLEEQVRQRTRELEETRLEIVHRLGRAAEYRDNETGNHVIRMSKFAVLMADHLGWPVQQCELIEHSSPMHDIGKIGIPDKVLLKPGKLDAEEWEIMKTHVIKGYEILSGNDSEMMVMARNIALHHHEKWDGTGYPNGLKGEEISPEGRIVAICDVFDALTSERPYKSAWTVEDSVDLIRQQKGKHFEPLLVDLFLNLLPQIVEIKENFTDTLAPAQT